MKKTFGLIIMSLLVVGSVFAKQPKNIRDYTDQCVDVQAAMEEKFGKVTLWHYRYSLWEEEQDGDTTKLVFTGSGPDLNCKLTQEEGYCHVICASAFPQHMINKFLKPVDKMMTKAED
jgi:hypothetical protein